MTLICMELGLIDIVHSFVRIHSYPYENNVYLSKLKANFSPLKFTFWP